MSKEIQEKVAGVFAAPKAYQKTIGAIPAVESAFLGGAGYLGGGFIAEHGAKFLASRLLAGKSPEERARIMDKFTHGGGLDSIKNWGKGLGAAAGALYPLYRKGDIGKGGDFMKSITTPGYWDDPENKRRLSEYRKQQVVDEGNEKHKVQEYLNSFQTAQEEAGVEDWRDSYASEDDYEAVLLDKEAVWGNDFDNPFNHPNIPVSDAINYFEQDRYLKPWEKQLGIGLMHQTGQGSSGLVSGAQLMRTAASLGTGYLVGSMFGKAMGGLFGLPTALTKELSRKGGYAAAITNTGIFRSLIK